MLRVFSPVLNHFVALVLSQIQDFHHLLGIFHLHTIHLHHPDQYP